MKKLFLLTAALATMLTGCMTDGGSETGGGNDDASMTSLNIRLSGALSPTRALEGKGQTTDNTNRIVNVHVFILDAAGTDVIDYAPVVVTSDLEAINGAGWLFPDPIPVDSRVYVLGNVHRDYNRTVRDLATLGDIRAFTSDIWTQTDYDLASMATVGDPVGLSVTSSGSATVSVELAPVISRLELHSLEAGGDVRGFTVTGVFLTNYHTAFTYGGGIPSGSSPIDNTLDLATNDGMTGDEANVFAQGSPLRAEMTGNRIWAYNVSAGSMPLLVVRMKNVMVGSKLHPGPLYLTVSSYGGTSVFRAGKIYRIPTLNFTQEHLTLAPSTDGINADPVEWDWEEITDPGLTTPGTRIHIVPVGPFGGAFPATGAAARTFNVNAGSKILQSWSVELDNPTHFEITGQTATSFDVRPLADNLTTTPRSTTVTVTGMVDSGITRATREVSSTYTVTQLPSGLSLSITGGASQTLWAYSETDAKDIAITSNVTWSAELTGGNMSDFTLTNNTDRGPGSFFTIQPKSENGSETLRSVVVTVLGSSGGTLTTRTVTLTQSEFTPTLTLNPTTDKGWEWEDTTAETYTVTSNVGYSVWLSGNDSDKFKINSLNGGDGYDSDTPGGTFTVSPIDPNTSLSAYTATLAVSATGVDDRVVALTQSAMGATLRFTPTGNPSAFTTAAGSATNRATKTVTANVRWTAQLEGGNADKFRFVTGTGFTTSVTVTPAATTDYTLGVEPVGANNTTTTYSTTVKLTSPDGAATQSFTVTQSPSAPSISLSPNGKQTWMAANTSANAVTIDVTTNWGSAWEIDPASYSTSQWSVVKSTNNFTVAPAAANGTIDARTATIRVRGTSASGYSTTTATLDVEQQAASPSLSISPTASQNWNWNNTAAGTTRNVTSNVTYTVSLSGTGASYFRINSLAAGATYTSPSTGGTFTVSPIGNNTSGSAYTATVTVQGSDGSTSTRKTYTATQLSNVPVAAITVYDEYVRQGYFVGSDYTLSCTVHPSNAADKRVNWATSDSAKANVFNGKLRIDHPGTFDVLVYALDGSGVIGRLTITGEAIPDGPVSSR